MLDRIDSDAGILEVMIDLIGKRVSEPVGGYDREPSTCLNLFDAFHGWKVTIPRQSDPYASPAIEETFLVLGSDNLSIINECDGV